ncbi:MAG: dipicolinate synthase subunit DpsA [Bacillota bacterium]
MLGGDDREKVLVKCLADRDYQVRVYAQEKFFSRDNIFYSPNIQDIISDSDIIYAPVSSTDEHGFLKASFVDKKVKLNHDLLDQCPPRSLFLIGIANSYMKEILRDLDLDYVEIARLDDFAILNAIPTAEGALKIAIEETPFTLFDSKVIILGLGRVGLTLAWRLKMLGAEVYSATRSKKAVARGKDIGLQMVKYDDLESVLPEIDLVFNTVPALIITDEYISRLKKSAVIIDLASNPGGTDFAAAQSRGIKALLATGLPGKVASQSAGEILGEIVPEIIENPDHYLKKNC